MIKSILALVIILHSFFHFSQDRVEPYYDSISGCWGFITQKKGKIVIPAEYDYAVTNYAMYEGNGLARNKRTSLGYFVNKGGFYGLINHFGEFTYPLDSKDLWQLTTTTLISYSRKTGEIYLHVDNVKKGRLIYDDVSSMEVGLFRYNYFVDITHHDNSRSLIDSSGREFYSRARSPSVEILQKCLDDEELGIDTCFDNYVYCKIGDTVFLYNLHMDQTVVLKNVETFDYLGFMDVGIISHRLSNSYSTSQYAINLNTLKQTKDYERIDFGYGDSFGYYSSKAFPYFLIYEKKSEAQFGMLKGILDYDFNEVIPPIYNGIYPLPYGFITSNYEFQSGLLSYTGDTIIPFSFNKLFDHYNLLHTLIFSNYVNPKKSNDELFGAMDSSGKIILPGKYKSMWYYNKSYTQFEDTLGGSYLIPNGDYNVDNFITYSTDQEMKTSIPKEVTYLRSFKIANDYMKRIKAPINTKQHDITVTDTISKNLFVAKNDSLYGLVNRNKKNITYFIYNKIEKSKSNKLLIMKVCKQIKFYNTTTESFMDGVFNYASPIPESGGEYIIAVKTNFVNDLTVEKFGVINLKGEVVIPFDYMWIDVINSTPENVVCIPFGKIKEEVIFNLLQK